MKIRRWLVLGVLTIGCSESPSGEQSFALAGGFDVTFKKDSDWGTGFCASVVMRNGGTSDPGNWSLEFDLDCGAQISSLWNGTSTRTGRTVHVDATWNKSIPPGGRADIGFCGTGSPAGIDNVVFFPGGGRGSGATACDGTPPRPPRPAPPDMAAPPPPPPPPPPPGNPSGKLYSGYFQSWSDGWKSNGADTGLAKLPSYVNVVNLAFMRPAVAYVPGSYSLGGTGLDFSYDGPTLRDAIKTLKTRNPGTRVLISVGGATYASFAGYTPDRIAAFVKDFGLDGVDVDYEPSSATCALGGDGRVHCPSDQEFIDVVRAFRQALPRPYWITIASWSVGAYGEGQWQSAPPASGYAGMSLALFRAAGGALDLVNVMSYDASNAYNPVQALEAYQHYFKGPIVMGVEVPPEAWGGHVYTIPEVNALTDAVIARGAAGMMLWSIHKPGTPSAQQMSTAICTKLALGNCNAPLLP